MVSTLNQEKRIKRYALVGEKEEHLSLFE